MRRAQGGTASLILFGLLLHCIMDIANANARFAEAHPAKRPRTLSNYPSRSPERRKEEKVRARDYRETRQRADGLTEFPQPLTNLLDGLSDVDASAVFPPPVIPLHSDPAVGRFIDAVNDALTECVCCVCAEAVCASELAEYDALPNMEEILQAPDGMLWLCEEGLARDDESNVHEYSCCRSCYRALARGTLPTTALANGLDLGEVPDALKDLSIVERILISPLRCKMTVMMLSAVAGPGTAQRAIKSHAVSFPQDVEAIADQLLPLPLSALSEQLVVVLVKDKAPTPAQMRTLFICRRQKVHNAIVWLLENRRGTASAYASMQLSLDRLAALEEDGIPQPILDNLQEASEEEVLQAHAGYTETVADVGAHWPDTVLDNDEAVTAPTIMDMSAYVDTTGARTTNAERMSHGFRQLVRDPSVASPAQTLVVPHESRIVNHYSHPAYWADVLPHLLPYARGGPQDERAERMSLQRWIKHVMRLRDPRFRTDATFLFLATNILLRDATWHGVRMHMRYRDLAAYESSFGSLSVATVTRLLHDLESRQHQHQPARNSVSTSDSTAAAIAFLRSHVDSVQTAVMFSDAAKKRWRQEMLNLMVMHGMPLLWLTVNPADLHSPFFLRVARKDESFVNALHDQLAEDSRITTLDQARMVAGNPYRAAQFFSAVCDALFTELAATFGKVKAHYGVVEAQNRGTLHLHVLLWIAGHTSATELAGKLENESFRAAFLVGYVDAICSARIPETGDSSDAAVPVANVQRTKPVDPTKMTRAQLDERQRALVLAMQCHNRNHTFSCFTSGNGRVCRFGFPRSTSAATTLDEDGLVVPERNDPWVAAYSPAVLQALHCNNALTVLTGPGGARGLIFYMTAYMSKADVLARDFAGAVRRALERIELERSMGVQAASESQSLLTKCSMAMVAMTQVAAAQAVLLLMCWPDHYVSVNYATLPINLFMRWLLSEDASETVALRFDNAGNLAKSSLLHHYLFRPPSLERLCLYDFVTTVSVGRVGGARTASPSMQFTTGHPDRASLIGRIRRKYAVPYLPYMPPSAEADPERHAAYHLLLLKPFRARHDLRSPEQSWQQAWQVHLPALDARQLQLVRNLEEIHCGLTTKQHLDQERHRQVDARELDPMSQWLRRAEGGDNNEDEDLDDMPLPPTEDVVQKGSTVAYSSNMFTAEGTVNDAFVSEALASAQRAGRFQPSNDVGPLDADRPSRADVQMWPKLVKDAIAAAEAAPADTPAAPDTTMLNGQDPHGALQAGDGVPGGSDPATLSLATFLDSIQPALNSEQRTAVCIIARHVIRTLAGERLEPLRLYLGGPGGTGKSHVLKTVRRFFETVGRADMFKVVAYTGAAALLVGGETAHHFTGLSVDVSAVSDPSRLEASLGNVRYVFLDEVGMLGAAMLTRVHTQLAAAMHTEPGVPFGGLNMIFAGDFWQLQPVGDRPLFMPPPAQATNSQFTRLQAVGRTLWTSLTHVVMLHQLTRQSDPVFQGLLTAVRDGKATDEHHALLLARAPLETNQSGAMAALVRDAPVVVARNHLRVQLLLHTALRNVGRCDFCLPVDILPKAPAALSAGMRRSLLLLSETSTGNLPGLLPLIVGDTYYLSKKVHHALSAVNGTQCELTAVVPGQSQPLALVVRIHQPARPFHLPTLPPNCLPLLPETATFSVPLHLLAAPVSSSGSVTIRRRQFALVHGSAITAHKAQGKTLERVVVDLREPPPARNKRTQPLPFGYVYTALSRARALDQLAVLAPFSASVLRQPAPAPLLEHARWLSELNVRTLAAANIPQAIDGAALPFARPTGSRPAPGASLHEQHLASLRAQSTHMLL